MCWEVDEAPPDQEAGEIGGDLIDRDGDRHADVLTEEVALEAAGYTSQFAAPVRRPEFIGARDFTPVK